MSLDIFAIAFVIITSILWYVNRGKNNKKINRTQNFVVKRSRSTKNKIRSIASTPKTPLRLIPETNIALNHSDDFLSFTLLSFDILNRNGILYRCYCWSYHAYTRCT